ncbi:gastrin-releasing peptide receptor-like protein [Leptotrombidium deliense]|uniref:Gastrin-releasing peptide receptor-like protein n=1 Tax=Leptotrombidium deliense TaxID=299467 RepID=A0A443SDD1_9ACAR|nr:gastrin-releasing peptide receptor-like protein [Leptotrombidium deliense]
MNVEVNASKSTVGVEYNKSVNDESYVAYNQRPETYIVPTVFAIIFLLGIFGNGILVKIFIKHKSMRTIPNTFLICLAIGDLLVMLGSVPFVSIIYTVESWPFGKFVCKLSEFLRDLSLCVTVFTLTMLSIDRYVAISSPYRIIRDNGNRALTNLLVGLIWITSFLFAMPSAYFAHILNIDVKSRIINICYPFPYDFSSLYARIIISIKFVLLYALPLFVITSFYGLMAKSLLNASKEIDLNSFASKQREKRVKVAKMILILVIIFAVCFLPNHVFLLWFYFSYPKSLQNYNIFWHVLKISGYVLTFFNSCLNPLILVCISHKFRSHFKAHFTSQRLHERRTVLRRKYSIHSSSSLKRNRLQSTKSTCASETTKV